MQTDYQVVVTPSGQDPILDHRLAGGGAGGTGFPAFTMLQGAVPTDGTTDARAALNTLVNSTMPATGPGRASLIVQPGEVVYLASSITIPPTVRLIFLGGVLKIASGAVLTLGHQPDAGPNQIFDISLGGTVAVSAPMTMEPVWFGADLTGAVNASPAVSAALAALVGHGGKCYARAGSYRMADFGQQFGDFGSITLKGDGPSTHFFNPTARTGPSDFRGIFAFYGGGTFGLQQLRVEDLRISGASTSDWTHLMVVDQCQNVHFRGVYIDTNAVEGIFSLSGENFARNVTFNDCHASNTGLAAGLSAFNINAQLVIYTGCTFDGCASGIENNGRWMTVMGCQFHNMVNYAILTLSTWAGYLDSTASFAEVHTYANIIANNQFVNCPNRAIVIPDYHGHTNTDAVHTVPAHLDGNLGKLLIDTNLFDRVTFPVWGGADRQGEIELAGNMFMGQYDAGTGPQGYAICPQGGTWNMHHNTFGLGVGIQWSQLVGYAFDTPKTTDRLTFLDNTVVNMPCNGPLFQFFRKGAGAIGRTRFIDNDGSIAAASTRTVYRIFDATTDIDQLTFADFAYTDTNHLLSLGYEPTDIPLASDTIPPNFSFKPGDRLSARFGGSWTFKRCLTGGTTHSSALAITGAATSGTKLITVTDATVIGLYQWISVPTGGVTPKRILGLSGNVATVDTNFEATVAGGTSVSWQAPTWATI